MAGVTVELVDHASIKLGRLTEESRKRLRAAIVRDGQEMARRVRAKLSGPVLKVKSGKLRASIKAEMRESQLTLYGRVFSSGVPYAAIHEYGGQTKPHVIFPKNMKALRFMLGGVVVFAAKVNHPGSKIPERSYLRSTLKDMHNEIVANITAAGRPNWS